MNPSDSRRHYRCLRATGLRVDARLTGAWEALAWTPDFVDITGDPSRTPRFRTRAKMGWDDRFFYVGVEMEEPHVWGTLTQKNSKLFEDNDFEVFIDPDCDGFNYYEFEINALGTIWELSLPKPYRDGGVPVLGCNLDGLQSAVHVRGRINDPSVQDEGWNVAIAFPWSGLAKYCGEMACPPRQGDVWRMNLSRVQWKHRIVEGQYERVPPHGTPVVQSLNPEEQQHPEDNWVWNPQGAINMHLPLRWGEVEFG
jgi:hypothetical protein